MTPTRPLPPSVRALCVGWVLAGALACATTPTPQPPAPAPAPVQPEAPPPEATPPSTAPAPAAPAITITGYTPEVATILAERYTWWRSGPTRIALARRGSIRLRPDGPELGLRDEAPFADPPRLRVVDDAERPRIVTDDDDVRLLLYVDRQDARPVVTRAAPLRPSPETSLDGPRRRGHVVLEPGAWVDIEEQRGALTRVSSPTLDGALSGWLDSEALGTTATVAEPPAVGERQTYVAMRSTPLLTRPGGKALVTLEEHAALVELDPRTESGHRWVEHRPVCEPSYSYVGFVRARDVYQPNYGSVVGCGSGGGRIRRVLGDAEAAPRVILDAGRFLLDADAPVVVGCVLAPTEAADLGDGRHAIATIWGPVPVRLAPATFEGRCGDT